MATILVLHGPNLNLLGTREPEIYGSDTLDSINQHLSSIATGQGHHLQSLQSNAEYELIDRIHDASKKASTSLFSTLQPLPIPVLPCAMP